MNEHSYQPADHYDRVTNAWQLLLGAELHYGWFTNTDEPLDVATHRLTQEMAAAARLRPGQKVLDVGCGTGAQACHLAATHGVEVTGITTSGVGVSVATERAAAQGLAGRVRFEQRDGTDNRFPHQSFDLVWILESSHLMRERFALISESARVLRPGGRLVWCDIVRRREIPFLELRERRHEFATLRAAFGDARMDLLSQYEEWFARAGLTVERADDLTSQTLPTFAAWRANAEMHRSEVLEALGEPSIDAFERSADLLERFWHDGTLGYAMIAAVNPA